MTALAAYVLIGIVLAGIWDICDPDAIKTTVNSWPRVILGVATGAVALIVLLLAVSASTWQIIAALVAWVLLAALRAIAD